MATPVDGPQPPGLDFFRSWSRRIVGGRVPVSGSVELTHRCNLRCVHCYLGRGGKGRSGELGTSRWLSLIGEFAAAGCMDLLVTGGEPLVRKDFGEIYRRAREAGLLVTVFTNGTLVDGGHLDLFADLPPRLVEISLYGATAKTYEAVTGEAGSYRRCRRGIEALLGRGVNVRLKTMLLEQNRREWGEIRRIAGEYGVGYRLDAALFPCLDGDRVPLESRVDPAEAVAEEFSDPDRAARWREYYERMKDLPAEEGLYTCGAGLTNFHVGPAGRLLPCAMAKEPSFDLRQGTFREGWEGPLAEVRSLKAGPDYQCNSCVKRSLCGLCPPLAELESGSPERPSEYLCRIGELRWQAVHGDIPAEND